MAEPIASVSIRWLTQAEGGRSSPPPGPRYAATAVVGSAPELRIAIWFEEGTASTTDSTPAEIGFLAPELLGDALAPGERFVVKEGPRTVAEGTVAAVWRHS